VLSITVIDTKIFKLAHNIVFRVRATFFAERVVNVWNSLPYDVDFRLLVFF